jgi:hypothetical protein
MHCGILSLPWQSTSGIKEIATAFQPCFSTVNIAVDKRFGIPTTLPPEREHWAYSRFKVVMSKGFVLVLSLAPGEVGVDKEGTCAYLMSTFN